MSQAQPGVVIDHDGRRGTIVGAAPPDPATGVARVLVRLDDGQQVTVDAAALTRREDGSYAFRSSGSITERVVVPVVEEELAVGKRERVTPVRVRTVVREREEVVDEPLHHETVEVERVPVGRQVDGPVESRTEGDTVIIPVLEEVLVVEKRLVLKEELRITLRRTEERFRQTVTLRSEEAIVEREDGEAGEAR